MSRMTPVFENVHVLYDPADGQIAYVHFTVTIEGGKVPSREEIEQAAHRAAGKHGVKVDRMDCTEISREAWERRTSDKIDLATKKLAPN